MPCAILLAEDNDDDVFFLKTAAKKAGWTHNIVVATNGREAIDILKRAAVAGAPMSFALVLLDLKLPFVSGLEVLQWSAQQPGLRYLPIVVFSSSEQPADIESAYRLGAASFLVKPSLPTEMVTLLEAIDAYWLQHNRLPAFVPGGNEHRNPHAA